MHSYAAKCFFDFLLSFFMHLDGGCIHEALVKDERSIR